MDPISANAKGIEYQIAKILTFIGEDRNREGLQDTPARVARSYQKLFGGYQQHPEQILSTMFKSDADQMVVLRDIEFYSTCEHHMIPFFGKATIGYIPNGRVVGISKLARLLECFARRLQIQEQLTEQIADAIQNHLSPLGVGVVVEAKHLCMVARGVEKQNSVMVTHALRGTILNDQKARQEFMECTR